MSESLTFMMGEFRAEFPCDRQYAPNHMWALEKSNQQFQFGFSAYAVRLLQDVYFLDWSVDSPCRLQKQQEMGSIESKKAESALYAPSAGKLIGFNDELMNDPSAINVDKYGSGWLFEMEIEEADFLTTESYVEHLNGVWEKTQRTIKGQLNE